MQSPEFIDEMTRLARHWRQAHADFVGDEHNGSGRLLDRLHESFDHGLDANLVECLTFHGHQPIGEPQRQAIHNHQPHLRLRFARYLVLWIVLTAISTAALMLIGSYAGLAKTWWCKPLIEIALGLISFLLSRHWVYRR